MDYASQFRRKRLNFMTQTKQIQKNTPILKKSRLQEFLLTKKAASFLNDDECFSTKQVFMPSRTLFEAQKECLQKLQKSKKKKYRILKIYGVDAFTRLLNQTKNNFEYSSSVRFGNTSFLKANTITPGVNRNFKVKKMLRIKTSNLQREGNFISSKDRNFQNSVKWGHIRSHSYNLKPNTYHNWNEVEGDSLSAWNFKTMAYQSDNSMF